MVIPNEIQRAFDSYLSSLKEIKTETIEVRNSYEERRVSLAQMLMPFPEEERLAFIGAGLLHQNPVVAMNVGELCLEDTSSLRALLKGGFPYLGTAQLRFWIPKGLLYFDKSELLTYINELSADPGMRRMAMYHFNRRTKSPSKE